ncbi:G-D-S-L family lipolytic protein [Pedobacter hiemivivus]|uniref:G-D-S-L family lipolytic protein n=1 Tax=Pedobacter hiemivivus TaxID=2530454 RepID=A0A4U1GU56_9SPHI|nr:GDSL-type esterase/lipase family protein [Pedobacter hiemivivus]TKC65482.1 G-D-S-L family lipolytic protein [Pedobacter hiemivivus]
MNQFKSSFGNLLKASLIVFLLALPALLSAQAYNTKTFEKNIKAFDKRDSIEKVQPGSNLFVGSSSITNWKDVADYFPESYVINRGFGGSKFEDLLYYGDRVIMPYKPAKIFIYEGDNDIAKGIDTETLIKQAAMLRQRIAAVFPKVPVVFISVKPSVARWELKDKYVAFNQALKKYAKKEKLTAFADVWTPMLDANGEVFKDVFLPDNLHMKPNGYQIWQKVLQPFLLKNKK